MTKPQMMAFEDIRAGDRVQKPGAKNEWVTVVATEDDLFFGATARWRFAEVSDLA